MSSEEQEILDGAREWAEAMISNDAERIGSFMADDWVIVSERGISSKEYFLSFVESGALTHTSFELVGEPRLKVYGDTAVLTTRATNTAFFNGQQFDADEFSTDVLIRRNGRWLCVLSHITSANKEFLEMIAARGSGVRSKK
ncbi:MAG TPA: nuclear transport factor 2 family protein [Pyrinomonadaceae bacterium]|nr:nuclear transport factor 2 family protein [Pyrinomonadaceae bacterium]